MTGLTKLQIETMKDKYIGLKNSKVRSVFTALAIYLIWYLGYAKVHGAINQTAKHLNEISPDTVVDGSDSEEE